MQLAIDSLSMSAGGRVLFSDLSFSVSAGQIVAVMGPSGVGKSTLLAGIAGQVAPTAGEIRRAPSADPKQGSPSIHWMFQSSPLLVRRTALDNVALAYELRGSSRADALERAAEVLETLGLKDSTTQRAYRLSGGERQRVAVARAIAAKPELLLADEPTASLDQDNRKGVTRALVAAAREGAIVLVATHDAWVAEQCDHVVDLREAAHDHTFLEPRTASGVAAADTG